VITGSYKCLRRGFLAAVITLAFASTARPAGDLPQQIQGALLLKLLGYDRNLPSRSPQGVVIALIADSAAEVSELTQMQGKKIQGKSVKVTIIAGTDPASLADALNGAASNAVYQAGKTNDATRKATLAWATAKKIPVFGGSRKLAEKGAAVGFAIEGGKPRIIINVKASRAQGVDFPSSVLRLANLINS
jgi:ABC-type uncharacterized transport system substrate-binding protein